MVWIVPSDDLQMVWIVPSDDIQMVWIVPSDDLQMVKLSTNYRLICNCLQHTTLHTTVGLLLKLSRVGPDQSLDGRPDAAGSDVGGPVRGTLSSGLKK